MKHFKTILGMAIMICLISSVAMAADFGWISDMNIKAIADPSGFRAKLAARFNIGPATIDTVISNVERPADAYMVMRLGEISHHPPEYVLNEYKTEKGKGWGAMAKSLGIKPGSKEFHALKRGHDLDGDRSGKGKKGKGKHEK